MPAQFNSGTVIFRYWNQQEGLSEISRTFSTLNELFDLCLRRDPQLLVERVVLDGEEREGQARSVTLVFQSVAVMENPTDSHPE